MEKVYFHIDISIKTYFLYRFAELIPVYRAERWWQMQVI
jgi:hypothetical protein